MKTRRLIAIAAVALGATALVGGSPAGAAPSPTLDSTLPLITYTADAYNIAATGPIHYAPHLHAACTVGDVVNKSFNLTVPGIGVVSLPLSSCSVDPNTLAAHGAADVTAAVLLGGRISIGAVHSRCDADDFGYTTVGSTVAVINGRPIGNAPGQLTIPGLATVYFNQNTESVNPETGFVTEQSIAVRVVVPGHTIYLLGRAYTTPTQTITLGECSIGGYFYNPGQG